jgi:hypothetical protein
LIEAAIAGATRGPLFPARTAVVCCDTATALRGESGPARAFECAVCQTRYTLLVKPLRRVTP